MLIRCMVTHFARPICMDPSSVARDKNCAQPLQHHSDIMFTTFVVQKFETEFRHFRCFKSIKICFQAFGLLSLIAVRKLFNNIVRMTSQGC